MSDMKPKRRAPVRKKKVQEAPGTHIVMIIDESGSMGPAASDVRGGFNDYVAALKADGNNYKSMSVIKFGTRVRPLFVNRALADTPTLDATNYQPRDTTALYDAIAYGLSEAERWGNEDYPYGTDRVLFVIMTDGYENASREYTRERIAEEIRKRQEAGNWTFIYMMADINDWSEPKNLGISVGNTLSYKSGETEVAFAALSDATTETASAASFSTMDFFSESSTQHKPRGPVV